MYIGENTLFEGAISVSVRLADGSREESLLRMPPYAKRKPDRTSQGEEVLVAERSSVICGAVSVSSKDISCLAGRWKRSYEKGLDKLTRMVSGGWISKLYVFPEYRNRGVGTRLVVAATERLRERGFSEVYTGINVKNEFREVSEDIFGKNGFKRVGSCVCLVPDGYCRGALLKKTIDLTKLR